MKKSITKFKLRGVSLLPVMAFGMGFGLVGLGIYSYTASGHSQANRAVLKWQANTLAESGVNVLYDQIRTQMLSEMNHPFNLSETNAYQNNDSSKEKIGSYASRVLDVREIQTDMEIDGRRVRRSTYRFLIEGTGNVPGGITSVVHARFNATVDRDLVLRSSYTETTPAEVDEFGFPIGALVSNEGITITTNGGFRTRSRTGLDGHVIANAGIEWNAKSGAKSSITANNVLDIQGQYLVPDDGAYTRTVAPTGIGNSNGSVNYRNPAAPASGSFSGSPENTVVRMPERVRFAEESTVNVWKNDWFTKANSPAANKHLGNQTTETLPTNADGIKIIQSPAIIDGDLEVTAGTTLRLMPKSTNPKDNVVYVRGNVKNLGSLLNLGVNIVIEGKYSDAPSAVYKIDNQHSPFAEREMVFMRAGMISVNKSPDSIKFTSNVTSAPGLVYSTLGGIVVNSSNTTFSGLLLAGGTGPNGGMTIDPAGGGTFTLDYEEYAATGGELTLDPESVVDRDYVPGGVSRGFTPSKAFQWVRIR